MATVAVLMLGSQERARVQNVLHGRTEVAFCDTDAELLHTAAEPDAVIIALVPGHTASRVATIAALRARSPKLPIFAYCGLDHPDVQGIVRATQAGINDVVLYGAEEAWIVLRTIAGESDCERVAHTVFREADHLVPEVAKPVFRHALRHIHPHATVGELAVTLGITRQALAGRLKRAELPTPRSIISWSRLLFAACVLDGRACTVERAAARAGFESAAALRHMLRAYTGGLRPEELRKRGGLTYLVGHFTCALGTPASEVAPRRIAARGARDDARNPTGRKAERRHMRRRSAV
jgi:AraC-like DNA-binding protein